MKTARILLTICITSFLLYIPDSASAATNMVPLRNVFESMGAQVEKKGENIVIHRNKNTIIVKAASGTAKKNGKTVKLYHPIRFIKEEGRHVIHVLDVHKLAKKADKEKHYRVRRGDTLSEIATKFGITVAQLKKWNNLQSNALFVNQHLHTANPFYTVKDGDNLWEIADENETTVAAIKEANDLHVDFLKPGQKLYIPIQPSMQAPELFAEGIFPLMNDTYEPYGNGFGNTRTFSSSENNNTARSHEGIDIIAPAWVPVFSVSEGTVINKGWNTYGGWRLTIKAPNGVAFYYAHMNGYPEGLKEGQHVSKGQLIGYVGDTGYGPKGTKGKFIPHLHLGMYDTNLDPWKPLNPFYYLKWWEMQP